MPSTFDRKKHLENRLNEWARWYIRKKDGCIGYPSASSIDLFRIGLGIPKYRLIIRLPSNDSAEEIECFIKLMAVDDRELADAIRSYYLGRHVNDLERAKALGISEGTFRINLFGARCWLRSALINKVKKGIKLK